ncbi:putative F-box/kelch-repeat protein At5g24040 [Carex rostrata]
MPNPRSSTDGVLSHERNWSELPQDILHLFAKKLHDISDFIRFRAVCKMWQFSAPVTDPPPQLPWLLECNIEKNTNIIRFYCLSSRKVHTITCPASNGAWIYGPACRYLLASHSRNSQMYLLNLLTHDQIYVPSVNANWCLEYIGPNSIEGGDIVIVSGIAKDLNMERTTRPNMIAFWRPKADDWVYVEGVGRPFFGSNVFYRGQFFSNDKVTGITNVVDIATKKLAYQVAPPDGTKEDTKGCTYMVESGGKILKLFQHYEAEQCHFDLHYLYFGDGGGKPCWVKITDIGDQMLFLQNHSGLSLRASNFVGFKGNCIYFLKDWRYLCRYDIGDGTTEVLCCPFDSVGPWFVPSLVKLSDIN